MLDIHKDFIKMAIEHWKFCATLFKILAPHKACRLRFGNWLVWQHCHSVWSGEWRLSLLCDVAGKGYTSVYEKW